MRSDRPAFDLVFVYDEAEGTLDTHAPGGRTIVADLQRIFWRVILGEELSISPSKEMICNLNGLLDRNFESPTPYQYGIDSVRVKKLRCTILGRSKTALTLESGDETRNKPVHDLLDDLVASERITKELLTVVQAGLQITFGGNLTRRRKTLSFITSSPNSCSLKFEPKHEIARQCLKDWGLDVSGSGNRNTELS